MDTLKKWSEIVLMPLVVAVIGVLGTVLVTRQQANNTREMANAQLESTREIAHADWQVQVLGIFAEKITSPEPEEQRLGLRLLGALDGTMAERLAEAVLEGQPADPETRRVAEQVAEQAAARAVREQQSRVYLHIQTEGRREAARRVGRQLSDAGFIVRGIERLEVGPSTSVVRYFWREDQQGAERIVALLEPLGLDVRTEYASGYSVRPGHFELWFGPDEPSMQ